MAALGHCPADYPSAPNRTTNYRGLMSMRMRRRIVAGVGACVLASAIGVGEAGASVTDFPDRASPPAGCAAVISNPGTGLEDGKNIVRSPRSQYLTNTMLLDACFPPPAR